MSNLKGVVGSLVLSRFHTLIVIKKCADLSTISAKLQKSKFDHLSEGVPKV